MYKSVHKKNPIKIGEGGKLVWGENEYVLTHSWFWAGRKEYKEKDREDGVRMVKR
jgi:hypothetical protein